MRPPIFAVLLVAGASFASARQTSQETKVRAVLDEQAAAWSRGDLEAFCAIYADDATFVSPSGLTSGRQAVLERYRKKYVDRAGM